MLRMSQHLPAALTVFSIAGLSACATSPTSPRLAQQHHFTFDYAALSNRTNEINHWIALNGDCSVAGYYSVQIVTPPAHGQAQVSHGQYYPRYGKLDARSSCDASTRDGLALNYTPSSGYFGPDHLTISVITPIGGYWTTDFNIIVPQPASAVAAATSPELIRQAVRES